MSDESFDVFISYGHQDQAWVQTLAENLHRAGLDVFLDAWEIAPGDVVVHRLERGLLSSRNGILIVSPASVARPWVQQEYAVLVSRAVAGTQRLIPVLLGDVEVPPFAVTRLWVDFRGIDGPEYERRVHQLVAALRGERPARPARGGRLQPPPGTGFRPEGTHRAALQIGPQETVFEVGGERVEGRAVGLSHRLEDLMWRMQRARRLGPQADTVVLREAGQPGTAGTTVHGRLVEVGAGLAEAFLPDPIRTALEEVVRLVTDQGAALQLALEIAEPRLSDLPWEALCLPELTGGPLVLHPRVELYRVVAGLGATTAIQIRGPLRILVVIGSPDQAEGGELLDYEAELRRILDAVEPARRRGHAYVRILNRGTVAEIRGALQAQRFHVLHVSCHARPGALVLEDELGRPDLVTAERLAGEALVADRGVPLVVLAGCSTALTERATAVQPAGSNPGGNGADQGEAALPGLARQLLGYGVPAVLAMNAPVTDPYATRLGARLYQELASWERPDPLAAVAEARRRVDAELRAAPEGSREAHLAALAEWATPVLAVRGQPLPLFNRGEAFEPIQEPPPPRLASGIVVRGVGDFVGRRREERLLLAALRGQRAGVVIHGIGGVGKSTLTAQLLADLGERAGLVVSLIGKLTVDQILDEVGQRLLSVGFAQNWEETHPLRRLAVQLREPKVDWADWLDLLGEHLLGQLPVALLLDNFEDNLRPAGDGSRGFEVVDPQLATFLATWIGAPGMSRLLITSRYPFPLPDHADRLLEVHHLGPLSLAETRKLVWRLPGLNRLDPGDLRRAYTDVGGHPRALEYLDALLRGGRARFADVTGRLEQALAARQIGNPTGWLAEVSGDLDRALAETVTLAVNDVLLAQLLDQVDRVPLARRLLLGISVYRLPVDEHGVAWQIAEEVTQPPDLQHQERLRQFTEVVQATPNASPAVVAEQLGLSQAELAELARELTEEPRPPLAVPRALDDALATLVELGLVAPVDLGDSSAEPALPAWVVHRWTAGALARLAADPDLVEAHRRAARYWRWRNQVWPQSGQADIADLLEARYHHLAAGDLDKAVLVTEWVSSQLHTWGAWSWVQQLIRETLELVPDRSREAANFIHELGVIAQQRGDYDQAVDYYRQALAINEELGDQVGVARSYHQLGIIAQWRGDHDAAVKYYRQALAIDEELGHRAGMANCYGQLGIVAQDRGDHHKAVEYNRQALAIFEELGDRANMAIAISQIGICLTEAGNPEDGLAWNLQSLAIRAQLGVPEISNNIRWLHHQRELLGRQRFEQLLQEQLGVEGSEAAKELLQGLSDNEDSGH